MAYPRVDRSHIVPAGYLSGFSVDGMLGMRLVGDAESRLISVRDAAVRTGYYRRTRPDGAEIDDVEWSLSVLENVAIPALRNVRAAWPLPTEEKAKLAQLFGYQLVRGPRWREWFDNATREFVVKRVRNAPEPLRTDAGSPATTEDIERFEQQLPGSTSRSTRMLSMGLKIASLLGSMHWLLTSSSCRSSQRLTIPSCHGRCGELATA
jgi:hypothetical protein